MNAAWNGHENGATAEFPDQETPEGCCRIWMMWYDQGYLLGGL